MRQAIQLLGENPDLLCHQVNRELFICELASNAFKILRGESVRPNYRALLTAEAVGEIAKSRWIVPRAERNSDFRLWRREQIDTLLSTEIPQLRKAANGKGAPLKIRA
jgi:hypothetical protein